MGERRNQDVYTSRSSVGEEDWAAVALALNERMAQRRIGQQELATLSGISVSTLRHLQHGAGRRVQNRTLSAISAALDWPAEHLSTLLRASPDAPAARSQASCSMTDHAETLSRIETKLDDLSRRLTVMESAAQDGKS